MDYKSQAKGQVRNKRSSKDKLVGALENSHRAFKT